MDDNRIIDLFWKRDESAIEEAAAVYGRYCRKIAFNILGNEEDTQECLNDTWLGAWNSIPPARPSCLSAFLGKIARNMAISKYRAGHALKRTGDRVAESLDELGECAASVSNNVEESVDKKALETAINRYLDSVSEIAGMYGLGQSDVKVTLMRMRRSLKKVLEDEGLMV